MSERAERTLKLLAECPRGISVDQMRAELRLGPKPMLATLAWLKSERKAKCLRIGNRIVWVTSANFGTLEQMLRDHIEAARQAHLRANKIRKRKRRIEKTRPGPVRVWAEGESSWTPPGPLIPSVWHLPQVLGVA